MIPLHSFKRHQQPALIAIEPFQSHRVSDLLSVFHPCFIRGYKRIDLLAVMFLPARSTWINMPIRTFLGHG